jgi:L-amino acid N-acyltransferase YncA
MLRKEFQKLKAMEIIEMKPDHWLAVKEIYASGIATGNATFRTLVPAWEQWDSAHVKSCRLVSIQDENVLGWAALTPVSDRPVYAGVAEVSVYLHESARGKGIGAVLLYELVKNSEQHNFWTLQALIFPENIASVKIHQSVGFRIIGTRQKIGLQNGVWRDTLLLERRSAVVGI